MFRRSAVSPFAAALVSLALFAAATMVHGKTPRAQETRFVEAAESLIRTNPALSRRA